MKVTMKALLNIIALLIVTAVSDINLNAQDLKDAHTVEFGAREHDAASVIASQKEAELKRAHESGRIPGADAVSSTGESGVGTAETHAAMDEDVIFGTVPMEENGDWGMNLPPVYNGLVMQGYESYYKNIDMKTGEDGNLYVAVIRQLQISDPYTARIDTYRSPDGGKNWILCGWFGYITGQISSLSLLVESKSNAVADSTRLIVFYSFSAQSGTANADLRMASFRRNGTAPQFAVVADPAAGYHFCSLSAVSDGEFWQSATYFGVVASERKNDWTGTRKLKFFRTANWGSSWTSAEYITGNDDVNPSAQFVPGSVSDILIATERRSSGMKNKIALIRSTWSPSSSFTEQELTNGIFHDYFKPCLTVKQNSPADSIMLTCTRLGWATYFYSTNGGSSWVIDAALSPVNGGTNKTYTWCSSVSSGESPFTAIYMSNDGDSITVRRGSPGSMGTPRNDANPNTATSFSVPVCATFKKDNRNYSALAYVGYLNTNVYFNQEVIRSLGIRLAIQGMYAPSSDALTTADTVSVILKSGIAPFTTIDSARCVIDPSTMTVSMLVNGMIPGIQHHIVIRHRNALETWSYSFAGTFQDSAFIDMTSAQNRAFGNNMIQVNSSPLRFALFSGDVNQDGTIDATDLAMIDNDAINFSGGYISTDLDGNNFVDASDMAIADNNAAMYTGVIRP
ncbi:MAG: hypothetical protein K1X85_04090 [Ignavibacteria bacterium]|nr:hypothetical protein [Ignavibacteria bacterium]